MKHSAEDESTTRVPDTDCGEKRRPPGPAADGRAAFGPGLSYLTGMYNGPESEPLRSAGEKYERGGQLEARGGDEGKGGAARTAFVVNSD